MSVLGIRYSRIALAITLTCLLAACLVALPAVGAAAEAAPRQESMQVYEGQLSSGQVAYANINRHMRRVHVTLKDGTQVFAKYGRHERSKVLSALHGRHVRVVFMSAAQEKAEQQAVPVHHKWRYIIGGVVLALLLAGGAAYLLRRRRLAME